MLSTPVYLWLKALHVIAVISWMAGLLYLPRLFVYHTQVAKRSEASELFKVMERRLVKAIMTPAALVAWAVGLVMAVDGGLFAAHWFHAKLLLLVLLTISHVFLMRCKDDFAADRNRRSQKFFRMVNEIPTLLMIGIVILVMTKAF